jgi:branched-chain amino acid transport system substrate-binding protein
MYVHYGFNQVAQREDSLGVLGMPLPEQSLPVLFEYLREEEGARSVLVMACGDRESVRQKGIAESIAQAQNLELVRLSRFDVSEEAFDLGADARTIRRGVERVVQASPDALLLVGCSPGGYLLLVDRLREGGYRGSICAENFQDFRNLAKLGEASNGVFYVGGAPSGEPRSEYYHTLKENYLDLAGEWSEEAEVKLYALEFILACIQHAGPVAFEETSVMYRSFQQLRFRDPFAREPRMIKIRASSGDGLPRQLDTPIRISKIMNGQSILVRESVIEGRE